MAQPVERGILSLEEYRPSSDRLGCCLRQVMPCSPRHQHIHTVAHILSHEMTLSVAELRQAYGEIAGGWSSLLRRNHWMLALVDIQVIEWGHGGSTRLAALHLPKPLRWHHAASIWITRVRKRKSLPVDDAARWIGGERGDVIGMITDNPFDFAEAGISLTGGRHPQLKYEEPPGLTLSNAGVEMTKAQKDAEMRRLFALSGICQGCGAKKMTVDELTLDRIFPGVLGGRYVDGNCQLLCASCNSRKGTQTMSYLWEQLTIGKNEFAKEKLSEIAVGRRDHTGRMMRDVINQRVTRTER